MRKVLLVLAAVLGVLAMHAAPMVSPAIVGHATHQGPADTNHVLAPCTAVLPSAPALEPPAGLARGLGPAASGVQPRPALVLTGRAARSHAPPDLHVLCISRT